MAGAKSCPSGTAPLAPFPPAFKFSSRAAPINPDSTHPPSSLLPTSPSSDERGEHVEHDPVVRLALEHALQRRLHRLGPSARHLHVTRDLAMGGMIIKTNSIIEES
jgi:hypothetical protein